MASSEIHPGEVMASHSQQLARSAAGERKLRRVSGWLMLFFLVQGELGAVWDREWHAFVGRDQFWTPPHTLIYSCVSGAGLIALALVLLETRRYYKSVPGVNDASTVPIFGFFHAPLGFAVAGFGALLALVSAPLDNYWHELYGIDIALWAPFHMMGVTGAMIGILGMVYIFASEAAIERRESQGKPRHLFLGFSALEWGALMGLAGILNFTLIGFLQFPVVSLGPLHISTYPIPLVTSSVICLIGAWRLTLKPGVATILVFLLLLRTLLTELFVPWAIRFMVAQEGLAYRNPGSIPYFRLEYALLPLAMLIPALIIDGFALWRIRRGAKPAAAIQGKSMLIRLGLMIAPLIFLLAPLILSTYSPYGPILLPQPGLPVPFVLWATAVPICLLILLFCGAVGALIGANFGDIWRWSPR
jgi:hypothetical protein